MTAYVCESFMKLKCKVITSRVVKLVSEFPEYSQGSSKICLKQKSQILKVAYLYYYAEGLVPSSSSLKKSMNFRRKLVAMETMDA